MVGDRAHWHLECVRTARLTGALGRWLGAPADRWWAVSPQGERQFMRLMDYLAAGEHDPPDYTAQACARLADWGFNGLGFGTNFDKLAASGSTLPVVDNLGVDNWGCGVWSGVFDDWHDGTVEKNVVSEADGLKGSPHVLGITWEYPGGSFSRKLMLGYAAGDAESAGKKALVAVIRARCGGSVERLRARMPTMHSFEELSARTDWDQYEDLDADAAAFGALVWDTHGRAIARAMRAKLPAYLNLGPILSRDAPLDSVRALAPHVDALTYEMTTDDGRLPRRYLEDVYALTGKPVLVLDFGMCLKVSSGGRSVVETEAGQAICYRRTAGGCAALPFVIGCAWAGYDDTPSNAWGFVDAQGHQRTPLITTARETNAQLDQVHRAGAGPYAADYFAEDRFGNERPRQAIGRLPGTVPVDADLGNWPGSGFWLKDVKLSRDLDPVVFLGVRAGWDREGLVLGFEVKDDAVELLDPRVYWRESDFIEVFVDASGKRPAAYGPGCFHFVLLPRGGGADGTEALAMAMHHPGDALAANAYAFKAVPVVSSFFRGVRQFESSVGIGNLVRRTRVTLHDSSWKLGAKIPWTVLGITPKPGIRLGFNVLAHRMGQREEEAFWAAPRGREGIEHPRAWGQLVLAERGE